MDELIAGIVCTKTSNERNVYPNILWFVSSPFKLQIESQNPQDPTKLKEIQFDLEDVPASLLQYLLNTIIIAVKGASIIM